ncbi:Adaptive-response sensory-kinase SasA [Paenibacillus allorhizoplanae]|uniref:histidine kinase n=1 Tax=Paenibacillus allorhizoplanae TaxID=2905648 RepID=A0ABM9BSY0_9BACL|nr:PAS domain S-box protein [Paenibacillus allorhizoplanae]CAH1192851.1 Adaptive-response sensory-kinase SasA [Paenibacillus allorhizoplanae]
MKLAPIELYDIAFNNASIGMAIVSTEGRFLEVNKFLCEMFGYELNELLSLDFQTITHPDDIGMNMDYITRILSGEMDAYHMNKRYIHKKGHVVWALLIVSLIRDSNGTPLFFFSQIHDITAVKEAEVIQQQTELVLKEKEERFFLLLEELPDGIFIVQNGSFQYLNKAAMDIIGVSDAEEAIYLDFMIMIVPAYHKRIQEQMQRLWLDERQDPLEFEIVCIDGENKHVEATIMQTVYKGGKAILGVFRDITDRKKSMERAIHADKLSMIGQLAAGVAHEIRNPLTSINGFIKLLKDSQAKEYYYEIIESELKRIEFITNELLILAKPNAIRFQKTCLRHLLEQVIELMSVQALMSDVEIVCEWMADEIFISCEPVKIKQVFINLLKNGIEAMPDGGVINLIALKENESALIQVQDQGCGIPPDQLAKIGQPFFTTKDSGTGLGIMITYNIIHHHGGTISIESCESAGTTFSVRFPLKEEVWSTT